MTLKRSTCKDLIISFTKNKPDFEPLVIAEGRIPEVSSAKVLGLNFSSDLRSLEETIVFTSAQS